MSRTRKYYTPTAIRRRLIKGCRSGQSDIEKAFLQYLHRVEIDSTQFDLCLDDHDEPTVRNIHHFMVDPDNGKIVRIPQSAVPLHP